MPRRLVVCCDGTWGDELRTHPSNVVKIAAALVKDAEAQRVFYGRGVATRGSRLRRMVEGAFGIGLGDNVKDAYRWLVNNYEPGDEIYFLGFSRGAFTVRSTAGMIRKVGLLLPSYLDLIPQAFHIYTKRDASPDTIEARQFRATYSHCGVPIRFIGVWDTVGALGVPANVFRWLNVWLFRFHNVTLSRGVRYAYHAVAIDEKRRFFKPALWEVRTDSGAEQEVQQAWFAGCHSDIGGGERMSGLSDVALMWMIEKARLAGATFEDDMLSGVHPDPRAGHNKSRSGFYRLIPPYYRRIGTGAYAMECLHTSVTDRRAAVRSYRPPNLVRYLDRGGPEC